MPQEGIIDFEGGIQQEAPQNKEANPANQPDTTHLSGDEVEDVTGKDGTKSNATELEQEKEQTGSEEQNTDSSTEELEQGTEVVVDGTTYTVNENGDLVDADNNVFKEAKDVANFIKENNVVDANEDLSIEAIQNAVGINVVDGEGNPVEFTNDADGVKHYVDSVIALKANEIGTGAVNKLFTDNPLLKQFIDYVQINGTPKGFGDIPDRSGIVIDPENKMQQEAIIRMAAKEFGNESLNDNYIKYLNDSGALFDEAKNQLKNLVGKDVAYKKELEKQAAERRAQEDAEVQAFWTNVADAVNKGTIGGYAIPENFVKEVNGQKLTYTRKDFLDYVASAKYVDEKGNNITGYQRDINNLSMEEALNKELLDAWLTFTNGSYKDLVDMAIQKEQVRRLVIKSKEQRSAKTIKIKKPNKGKTSVDDIIF